MMVINRYNLWKFLYIAVPVLLLTDLAFGTYSIVLWGWELPFYYVRNFLFVGLPYFAIGTMIKKLKRSSCGLKAIIARFNVQYMFSVLMWWGW